MNHGEIKGYINKVFKLFVKESRKPNKNYLWNETNLDLNLGSIFQKKNWREAEFQTFIKVYRILLVEALDLGRYHPRRVAATPVEAPPCPRGPRPHQVPSPSFDNSNSLTSSSPFPYFHITSFHPLTISPLP